MMPCILRKINRDATKPARRRVNDGRAAAWFTKRCLFRTLLRMFTKERSMQRLIFPILAAGVFASGTAQAQYLPSTPPMVVVQAQPEIRGNLGGGFIEFLFGDSAPRSQAPPPRYYADQGQVAQQLYASTGPAVDPMLEPPGTAIDPQFMRQEVAYRGNETPGTIVIDTPQHFLYLVEPDGKALRYGIGVGRPGFTWSGSHTVSSKKEWPDWVPPPEMLQRRPDLPHFMAGGPNNPLGARAMYLGSTLYRIHGSNEPWSIGQNVSSGCIRMRNVDIIDLYERVKLGTKVIVL
jgi:lipoprotein-anchoring transpeptidase ErfK/SrfK